MIMSSFTVILEIKSTELVYKYKVHLQYQPLMLYSLLGSVLEMQKTDTISPLKDFLTFFLIIML